MYSKDNTPCLDTFSLKTFLNCHEKHSAVIVTWLKSWQQILQIILKQTPAGLTDLDLHYLPLIDLYSTGKG